MEVRNAVLDVPSADGLDRLADGYVRGELQETEIEQLTRQGIGVDAIANRFGMTRAAVTRVANEGRARRLLERKVEPMRHPSFEDPAQRDEILGPLPAGKVAKTEVPEGVPSYLAELYRTPLLTRDQEAHLFRKMNYLKYQASLILSRLDPLKARAKDLDEIERLLGESLAVKNQIIRANLRLVVSIAKRRIGPNRNFFELVSDGNVSLIRAVEKFDFSRGNKFSTYATWAIIRNYSRSIPEEDIRRDRFRTGHDEVFELAADHVEDTDSEAVARRSREVVQGMIGRLSDRERRIIVSRYGIDGANAQTLEQIGKELGVTKERVRQIETRAREKLRQFAADDRLDPSAL